MEASIAERRTAVKGTNPMLGDGGRVDAKNGIRPPIHLAERTNSWYRARIASDEATRREKDRQIRSGEYRECSWTAISRVPYLKTLVLWFNGTGWNGGGLFVDNKKVVINHLSADEVRLGGWPFAEVPPPSFAKSWDDAGENARWSICHALSATDGPRCQSLRKSSPTPSSAVRSWSRAIRQSSFFVRLVVSSELRPAPARTPERQSTPRSDMMTCVPIAVAMLTGA